MVNVPSRPTPATANPTLRRLLPEPSWHASHGSLESLRLFSCHSCFSWSLRSLFPSSLCLCARVNRGICLIAARGSSRDRRLDLTKPMEGLLGVGIQRVACDRQQKPSSSLVQQSGRLAGLAEPVQVGRLILAVGLADLVDEFVDFVDLPGAGQIGFGGGPIPLEEQGLPQLRDRDAVIGLVGECVLEVAGGGVEVVPHHGHATAEPGEVCVLHARLATASRGPRRSVHG